MLKYDIGTKSPVILGRIRVKLSLLCINCDVVPWFCPLKGSSLIFSSLLYWRRCKVVCVMSSCAWAWFQPEKVAWRTRASPTVMSCLNCLSWCSGGGVSVLQWGCGHQLLELIASRDSREHLTLHLHNQDQQGLWAQANLQDPEPEFIGGSHGNWGGALQRLLGVIPRYFSWQCDPMSELACSTGGQTQGQGRGCGLFRAWGMQTVGLILPVAISSDCLKGFPCFAEYL